MRLGIVSVSDRAHPRSCMTCVRLGIVGVTNRTHRRLADDVVARAQAAGELRPDVVPEDVPMLMCGLGRATGVGGTARPEAGSAT